MAKKTQIAKQPLLLRCNRLMEAFAKSDDERDFYLDSVEGFIVYVDLDKSEDELDVLAETFENEPDRFHMIPKLSFYESKKIMEGFVYEKVYDIDTKEKLLDVIQAKEPREHFLEFLYDHEAELEKWQQYYQERSRVRIIEWLREFKLQFVFEEDLDFTQNLMEKLKTNLFESRVGKEVTAARKLIAQKAKTYYSNEALNPRPKRGRPPKQSPESKLEPQICIDVYTAVPKGVRPFLFTPDITSPSSMSFSAKYDSEEAMLAQRKDQSTESQAVIDSLNQKLAELKGLSTRWLGPEESESKPKEEPPSKQKKKVPPKKKPATKKAPTKKKPAIKKAPSKKKPAIKKAPTKKKSVAKVKKKK